MALCYADLFCARATSRDGTSNPAPTATPKMAKTSKVRKMIVDRRNAISRNKREDDTTARAKNRRGRPARDSFCRLGGDAGDQDFIWPCWNVPVADRQ